MPCRIVGTQNEELKSLIDKYGQEKGLRFFLEGTQPPSSNREIIRQELHAPISKDDDSFNEREIPRDIPIDNIPEQETILPPIEDFISNDFISLLDTFDRDSTVIPPTYEVSDTFNVPFEDSDQEFIVPTEDTDTTDNIPLDDSTNQVPLEVRDSSIPETSTPTGTTTQQSEEVKVISNPTNISTVIAKRIDILNYLRNYIRNIPDAQNGSDNPRNIRHMKAKLDALILSNIRILQKTPTLETLAQVAKRDLKNIETTLFLQSKGYEPTYRELLYINEVLNSWDINTVKNLLISNNGLLAEYTDAMDSISNRVQELQLKVTKILTDKVINHINNNTTGKKIMSIEELYQTRDIHIGTRMFGDLSAVDNILVQSMDTIIKNMTRSASIMANAKKEELQQLIKGIDVQKFIISDESGVRFISPFTEEYYDYINSLKQFKSFIEGVVDEEQRNKLTYAYNKKRRENEEIIEVGFFLLKDYKSKRFKSKEEYIEYLKTLSPDYQRHVDFAISKYNDYLTEKRFAEEQIINKILSGIIEVPSGKTAKEVASEELSKWININSPMRFIAEVYLEGRTKYLSQNGDSFVHSLPKKNVEGKKYYSADFSKLSPKELEFYYKYNTFIRDLTESLPESVKDNIGMDFFPKMKKDWIESIARLGLFRYIKDSDNIITSAIAIDGVFDQLTYISPITNKKSKNVPIYMIRNNIRSDEQSIDFLKVMEQFIDVMMLTKARMDSEAQIVAIQTIIDDVVSAIAPTTTGTISRRLSRIALDGKPNNLMVMVSDTVDALLYGRRKNDPDRLGFLHVSKSKAGINELEKRIKTLQNKLNKINGLKQKSDADIIKELMYKDKIKEYEDELRILKGSKDEKKKYYKDLVAQTEKLEDKLEKGEIEQEQYEKELYKIEQKLKRLGMLETSVSQTIDSFIKYNQARGMGLNIRSAAVNLVIGRLNNYNHSVRGSDFTKKDFRDAESVVLRDKRYKTNSDIAKLMVRLGVSMKAGETMRDIVENTGSTVKRSRTLEFINDPYIFQSSTEFYNQATLFIAMLKGKKIMVREKGNEVDKEVSLYDAIDIKTGEFKDIYEKQEEWTIDKIFENVTNRTELSKFRDKFIAVSKRLHGNYDDSSFTPIKKYALGRLVTTFRSWIYEGLRERFGAYQTLDEQYGGERKGRYISVKDVYKSLGTKESTMLLLQSIIDVSKRNPEYFKREDVSDLDIENFRAAAYEVRNAIISLMGMLILSMMFAFDDDDDDSNIALNILLGTMINTVDQATSFLSPSAASNILQSPIPGYELFGITGRAFTSTYKYIFKDDYKGEHPLYHWARVFPYTNFLSSFYYSATNRPAL